MNTEQLLKNKNFRNNQNYIIWKFEKKFMYLYYKKYIRSNKYFFADKETVYKNYIENYIKHFYYFPIYIIILSYLIIRDILNWIKMSFNLGFLIIFLIFYLPFIINFIKFYILKWNYLVYKIKPSNFSATEDNNDVENYIYNIKK